MFEMRRYGFSLVGLLMMTATVLILLVLAVPCRMNSILNAQEVAAIREVQMIHTAEMQYASQFGKFACSLEELQKVNIISAELASREKNGYLFTLTCRPGSYTLHANPRVFPSTGRRTFYIDQDGVVHQNWGQDPATAENPEL